MLRDPHSVKEGREASNLQDPHSDFTWSLVLLYALYLGLPQMILSEERVCSLRDENQWSSSSPSVYWWRHGDLKRLHETLDVVSELGRASTGSRFYSDILPLTVIGKRWVFPENGRSQGVWQTLDPGCLLGWSLATKEPRYSDSQERAPDTEPHTTWRK